ncbi:hypothetical protein EUX98_g5403 [Antrodiella citrinella]|uniref:Uncharacterized protein n=1 Tax=Antrodiella citrinella TaxID=2447956 RepID=A0A4S4MZD6_9APHY|nr:hypothetical protein EUX98_g5403 [Antrodiella citrinella]
MANTFAETLVTDIRAFFKDYDDDEARYREKEARDRDINNNLDDRHAMCIALHDRLIGDPFEILAFFDAALSSNDWPALNRLSEDKFPPTSITKEETEINATETIGYSHTHADGTGSNFARTKKVSALNAQPLAEIALRRLKRPAPDEDDDSDASAHRPKTNAQDDSYAVQAKCSSAGWSLCTAQR